MNNEINESAKKEFSSLQIANELIRIIGLLDMKECIPVLKQKLSHCIESDCLYGQEKAYRYTLARLGDEEQRRYVLDILVDIYTFSKEDIAYFRDDEITWRYIELNYFSDKPIPGESGNSTYPASLAAMSNVYPYIKNIPEALKYPRAQTMQPYLEWAKSFYEWLMANKANIAFDYDGEKKYPLWHT
ncbi:MAG: hypothetical protein LBU22_09470 [Dysgonamonadaceae bacterium]|jgi:hypothetical protein|nr:hypothetical protein [Dysgonamonadaceae bacterium]